MTKLSYYECVSKSDETKHLFYGSSKKEIQKQGESSGKGPFTEVVEKPLSEVKETYEEKVMAETRKARKDLK